MQIVGVNNCIPILHMSKIMVYCYTTGRTIITFLIYYMVNPSLKFNNSTVILNWQTRLIKNYLSKGLSIIEQGKKQLSLFTNDVKLRVNLNNQFDTDYVMVKNRAISAVAKTIKKLHIQKDMNTIYKQDFYKHKEKEVYDFFSE